MLTNSQRIILALVSEKDGALNWYKIGRSHLHELDSPADFDSVLKFLEENKLVELRTIENEPLPRLFITNYGKECLAKKT